MKQTLRAVGGKKFKPPGKALVCVTDQKKCDRIIRAGRVLADMVNRDLAVVNVSCSKQPQDPQSLEYLFAVSSGQKAEMILLYSDDVAKAIIRYIKDHKVDYVLTGVPREGDSVVSAIWEKFTHITFFVVEADGSLREISRPVHEARRLASSEV